MVLQRAIEAPEQSFFLFGARGTGKSTWARATFAGGPYFDLLDQEAFVSYQRDPGRFGRQLAALPSGETIVVDEVQRIPALLNEVHRAIEGKRQRFVLLGSSSRRLKRAGVNLLGGRASTRTLFPLLPSELGGQFDLEEALRYGTLPIVWASPNRKETLTAYTDAYVTEEIRAEALARDLGSYVRFLSVAALFHAQTINMTELGRQTGVARTTVEGYFSVLEDTLLSWRLPAFEHHPRVRERAHAKVYWIDAGIVRSLKGSDGPIVPEERGALLEGWVANTLRAAISYQDPSIEFSYLPKYGSHDEVDFFLRRDDQIVAIEVKNSNRVDSRSLKGLRSIAEVKGVARRILLCGVERPERTDDGIDVQPFNVLTLPSILDQLFET
jgi:predicted AAA+ superfamily ATPase